MNPADEYTYTISYDDRDGIFVARVAEFRSLAAHGDTAEEALKEIRFIVGDVIRDLEECGEPIPAPYLSKEYGGRSMVAIPDRLHDALAQEAQTQGVSLSQFLVGRLAGPAASPS